MRRLRRTGLLRGLVRETELSPAHLVYPMFVRHGLDGRAPIASMPGIDHLSVSAAVDEAGEAAALGIPAVLLFGLPAAKDEAGSGAWDDEGIVQTRHARDQGPASRPPGDHRPLPVRVHEPRALRRPARGRRGRQRPDARAARPHRGLPGRGRRRRRRAERHDGRPGRRAARRARRPRARRDADHGLLRQVRLRVLRPVPRGRRVGPVQGRPPRLPDGSRQRARGRPRGQARRRRGRRRPHGQARAARTST